MEFMRVHYKIDDDMLLPPNGYKVVKQTKKLLLDKIKIYIADKVIESFSHSKSIMFYDASFKLVPDYSTHSSILDLEVRYEIADASSYARQDTRTTNNEYHVKFDLGVVDVYEPKQEPKQEHKEKFKLDKKVEPKIKRNKEKFKESDFFDNDNDDNDFDADGADSDILISRVLWSSPSIEESKTDTHIKYSDYKNKVKKGEYIKYSDYEDRVKKGEKDLLVKSDMNAFSCDGEIYFSKYDKMPNSTRIGFVYKVDYFSIIVSVSGKLCIIARHEDKTLSLKEVEDDD